jgi:cell wall assembly regulator SMI1
MSTQQIGQVKKELDAENTPNWHAAWIPFLDDDNDNYVCLDNRQPGYPVRECWRGRQEHAIVAESLTAWVENLVKELEQGLYVEDQERGTFNKKT